MTCEFIYLEMGILDSIILGIIEGITEFLPISSTAHLILSANFLKISDSEFLKSFEIIIQTGAIFAVIAYYFKKLLHTKLIKRLIVGFIPTGIIGMTVYKVVKQYFLGNIAVVLWSLFVGGIIMILIEKLYFKNKKNEVIEVENISYSKCLLIGLFQSLAVIPGVSRSAATIIGGMCLGISRKTIVEFSFLLAVPTIVAASVLDIYKNIDIFVTDDLPILGVGFVASFLSAMLAIKFLLNYVKKHDFTFFGIYRILLVLFFLIISK